MKPRFEAYFFPGEDRERAPAWFVVENVTQQNGRKIQEFPYSNDGEAMANDLAFALNYEWAYGE